MLSKPLSDMGVLLLATDVAAMVWWAATAAELNNWPVSSATAAAVPQPRPPVRSTTLEPFPS